MSLVASIRITRSSGAWLSSAGASSSIPLRRGEQRVVVDRRPPAEPLLDDVEARRRALAAARPASGPATRSGASRRRGRRPTCSSRRSTGSASCRHVPLKSLPPGLDRGPVARSRIEPPGREQRILLPVRQLQHEVVGLHEVRLLAQVADGDRRSPLRTRSRASWRRPAPSCPRRRCDGGRGPRPRSGSRRPAAPRRRSRAAAPRAGTRPACSSRRGSAGTRPSGPGPTDDAADREGGLPPAAALHRPRLLHAVSFSRGSTARAPGRLGHIRPRRR